MDLAHPVPGSRAHHDLDPADLPSTTVPFTLHWNPNHAHAMAVARFVHAALTAELPPGWHTQPDHLHHRP